MYIYVICFLVLPPFDAPFFVSRVFKGYINASPIHDVLFAHLFALGALDDD